MSGDILEQQQNQPQEPAPSSEKKETVSKKSLFGNLNSDLKQALNTWETLTEEMTNKVSPDEEQLHEVKRLLGELKSKLNEFND
ncbi:hypothetical protein [Bdellovibrio sp.]|uniref:hypothetical protein n=1 Tax=Bdellovibrio TaxID=958 RepID=UPI003222164C